MASTTDPIDHKNSPENRWLGKYDEDFRRLLDNIRRMADNRYDKYHKEEEAYRIVSGNLRIANEIYYHGTYSEELDKKIMSISPIGLFNYGYDGFADMLKKFDIGCSIDGITATMKSR